MKYFLVFILLLTFSINGQVNEKYNYKAQKNFIHKELGEVYLGMPLADLIKHIDISKADAGPRRYNHLDLELPVELKSIEGLVLSVHGIDAELQEQIITTAKGTKKNDDGEEFETDVYLIDTKKIPTKAFVYAITIKFKSDYDARSYAYKTFGEGGTEHDPSDEYKFYDTQWVKKTADGLNWLIRSTHDDRKNQRLQLLGRIDGTPWGLDGIN